MIPVRDSVPRRHTPLMIWTLIAVNGFVFWIELGLSERQVEALFYQFGLVPARYSHPEWAVWVGLAFDEYWPFVTSMFLHGGWLHLIGNMWTLWIFGDNVEDRMGPGRFLAFYLLCGLAAGGVHWMTNSDSTMPTVGASGAIAGVLAAYFCLFPRAQIITVIPILFYPLFYSLPAILFALVWIATQVFSGFASLVAPGAGGGVAWWAHIGGFTAGLLLHRVFLNPSRGRRFFADEFDDATAWLSRLEAGPGRVPWT